MTKLVTRLRTTIGTLGNAGALANAHGELIRTASAHAAVDLLEQRLATVAASPVALPDAA
jgi:hypothetical protein